MIKMGDGGSDSCVVLIMNDDGNIAAAEYDDGGVVG